MKLGESDSKCRSRLQAEGLSARNFRPRIGRTDLVLMSHRQSDEFNKEFRRKLLERKFGIISTPPDEPDELELFGNLL